MGAILEETKPDTEGNEEAPEAKMTKPEDYHWDLNFPNFIDYSDKYRLLLQERFMV